MEIPDELWDQIVVFLHKVDDGLMEYMETYVEENNVYDDAAKLLEAVAKLEEERGG